VKILGKLCGLDYSFLTVAQILLSGIQTLQRAANRI